MAYYYYCIIISSTQYGSMATDITTRWETRGLLLIVLLIIQHYVLTNLTVPRHLPRQVFRIIIIQKK